MNKKDPNTNKSRSFFVNTTALFILQVANYMLPFVLVPYLTRVLGASLYGIIAFGFSLAQISCILTDYGFNISATYMIAKNRDNKEYINKVISSVFVIKCIFLVIVFLLMTLYLTFQTKYAIYTPFFWLMYISIVGQTFQPIWLFQGLEKMLYITLFTVTSRIIYLLLVVYLVKSQNDYFLVGISNGTGHVIAAVIGVSLFYKLGYSFVKVETDFIVSTFKESTQYFWSRAAVATYSSCGAFYLGIVSTPLEVAYYSAAEQLYRGARALYDPVSASLYPHMATHKNFKLFFSVLKWSVLVSIIGIVVGSSIGHWVLELVYGSDFTVSYPILIVFLFIFCVTTPSILLGYPFLGSLGYNSFANKSVIYAGIIQLSLLLLFYILKLNKGFEVVFTVLIVESVVLLLRATKAYSVYNSQQVDIIHK